MDIKPANILRHFATENSCTYKIGDLGLVCPSDERVYDEGDCRYVAREVIEGGYSIMLYVATYLIYIIIRNYYMYLNSI